MFYDGVAEPLTFAFLLVDDMSMMSLASAVEPLRSANRLLGRKAFAWRLCSLEGGPITASNEIVLATQPAAEAIEGAHAIFVCGGMRMDPPDLKRYAALLRFALRGGLAIGSLSTASYLLARAGLLDGYRCTIHWENGAAFEEDFPDLIATSKIYEIDRDRLTCSGGTAAMDMMLRIIADRHGSELAQNVANQFHHERIRGGDDEQLGGRQKRENTLPPALQKVIHTMRGNLEVPASIVDLARLVNLSSRQLERLFTRYLDTTPAHYYLSLRIDRARELLLYTNQPILDVAVAVGFASTSHFAQWFRHFHDARPTEFREKARLAAAGRT